MEPVIKTGALTIVHFCDLKDCTEGDIITYYSPDFEEYITHRIVAVGDDYVVTRGDANDINDPTPVIDDMLYGKVIAIANFTAPLFLPYITERALDRGALIGVIMSYAVAFGLFVYLAATCITWAQVYYEIAANKIDSASEEEAVSRAATAISKVKEDHPLSMWRRMRLYVRYCKFAKSAEDVKSLLNKYDKE